MEKKTISKSDDPNSAEALKRDGDAYMTAALLVGIKFKDAEMLRRAIIATGGRIFYNQLGGCNFYILREYQVKKLLYPNTREEALGELAELLAKKTAKRGAPE